MITPKNRATRKKSGSKEMTMHEAGAQMIQDYRIMNGFTVEALSKKTKIDELEIIAMEAGTMAPVGDYVLALSIAFNINIRNFWLAVEERWKLSRRQKLKKMQNAADAALGTRKTRRRTR